MSNTKRKTLNVSVEAKNDLESVKATGQSYDGIIRELVQFWKENKNPKENKDDKKNVNGY